MLPSTLSILASLILTRLYNTFCIYDLAVSFFCPYLRDRTKVVTVNEMKSSPSLLTCGDPQGSVLGQILFILYTQPLSGVICHQLVSHHMLAVDTELYKCYSPSEAFTLGRTIEACISDVKGCVVHIQLRLNDDKTEHLLTCSVPGIDLPSLLRVEQSNIPFFSAARNFGVIFDS